MKKNIILILTLAISFFSYSNISFIDKNNSIKHINISDKIIKKNKENINEDKNLKNKIIILKKSKELLGKKYVWGAKVGDLNNFDCSSFVKTLYKEIGVNLPRVSKNQSKIGKKIELDDLEVGDLIFFHTLGNYVSHVGIYIGNNKFIHASSKAKKTIVSELKGYYRKKAVFGTRIV